MRILVTGAAGYTGTRLVAALAAQGHNVRALVRTPDAAPPLRALGARVTIGDVTDPVSIAGITVGVEVIYHLAGTLAGGPAHMRRVLVDGTRNLIRQCQIAAGGSLRAFIFTSNALVYGDGGGAWLSEATACQPRTPLGHCNLAAEEVLRQAQAADGLPAIILRLGAIYGPGRLSSAALRAGTLRLIGDGANYSSRIHVDDLISILSALRHGAPRSLYCVGDEMPTPLADYYHQLAALLDVPPPSHLSVWCARARGRLGALDGRRARSMPHHEDLIGIFTSDLRLDGAQLRADLDLRLRYPSCREGLPAALAAEQAPRGAAPYYRTLALAEEAPLV